MRTRDDTIYSTTGYRDWTLQGTVIARYSWADADTVCLHTACDNVPNRVVSFSSIREVVRLSNGKTETQQPEVPTWTLAGSRGSVYTVRLASKKYSCSCPGFQFRNHCRHVEQVRSEQKLAA